jgi:hypothetical protein
MKKLFTFFAFIISVSAVSAQCTELFFSEYVEGTFNNKALEIYNPTSQDIALDNYRIVRYANGGSVIVSTEVIPLAGTIKPYKTFVVVLDLRNPNGTGTDTAVFPALQAMADTFICTSCNPTVSLYRTMCFNGDDALSLEKYDGTNWNKVDIIGKIGEQPTNSSGTTSPVGGWATVFPHNNGQGAIVTRDMSLVKKASIKSGVSANPTAFNPMAQWDTIGVNNFTELQKHNCDCSLLSVNSIKSSHEIMVYPNPATGKSVSLRTSANVSFIEIYHISGRKVLTQDFTGMSNQAEISLEMLSKGFYMLHVHFADKTSAIRKIDVR